MLFQEVDINGPIPDRVSVSLALQTTILWGSLTLWNTSAPEVQQAATLLYCFFIRLKIILLEFGGKQLTFRGLITNPHLSLPLLRCLQPKQTRSFLTISIPSPNEPLQELLWFWQIRLFPWMVIFFHTSLPPGQSNFWGKALGININYIRNRWGADSIGFPPPK